MCYVVVRHGREGVMAYKMPSPEGMNRTRVSAF